MCPRILFKDRGGARSPKFRPNFFAGPSSRRRKNHLESFPREHNRAGKFYLTPAGTWVIKKGQDGGPGAQGGEGSEAKAARGGDSCTGSGLPSC